MPITEAPAPVAEAASPIPAALAPASSPAPASEAAAEACGDAAALSLRAHFARLSALIDKAERVAEAMLDALLVKVQRRETVYSGELTQVCRGLHMLARCGAELGRMARHAGLGATVSRGISSADIDKLAERLRPLFERQAA